MQFNVKGYQGFTEAGEALVKHIDPVASRSYVWDTNSLDWVPATAGSSGGPSSDVTVLNFPSTQQVAGSVSVSNQNGLTDAELRATAVHVAVDNFPVGGTGLTNAELRASPVATTTETAFTFLANMANKAISKLTYSLTGLRVDCGGSQVAVSSLPTLANVTTVAGVTSVAGLGYNNQNGQAIQQSQLLYQCGFRRNIT